MSFFSSPPDIVQTQSSEEGFAPDVLTVAGHSCSNVRDASTDPEDAHLPSTKSRKPSSKRMGCLGLLTQEVVPRLHKSKFVSRCIHHCSCPVAVLSFHSNTKVCPLLQSEPQTFTSNCREHWRCRATHTTDKCTRS